MELKRFYRTQRELAVVLNRLIDSYWADQLKEEELITHIQTLYENNNDKLLKNNDYTTVVIQQCGKRRLAIVSKILDISRENSIV